MILVNAVKNGNLLLEFSDVHLLDRFFKLTLVLLFLTPELTPLVTVILRSNKDDPKCRHFTVAFLVFIVDT
jgi:hypothetical protein